MNLKVLKKTRQPPKEGDVFIMVPPDDFFLYGQVISVTGAIGPMRGCILVYIYSTRSSCRLPVPELKKENLLIPPLMTNSMPWSKGYFETVENRSVGANDRLPQHCFVRAWTTPPQYFDEKGLRVGTPVGPIGEYGLQSYQTIDDSISRALGIPLSTGYSEDSC